MGRIKYMGDSISLPTVSQEVYRNIWKKSLNNSIEYYEKKLLSDENYILFCDKYVKEIREYLDGFYLSVDDKYKEIILERKEKILEAVRWIGIDSSYRERFISYCRSYGYNFVSLYIIALEFNNILDVRMPFEAYVFDVLKSKFNDFQSVVGDVSVEMSDSYNTFFYSKDFDKMMERLLCSSHSSYYLRPDSSFCLGSLLKRINNLDYSIYYDDVLVESCREPFGHIKEKAKSRGRYRFADFNDRINRCEDNSFIREEIFSKLRKLESGLFKCVWKDDKLDSFIECMKLLFDSDSYSELNSKLNTIIYVFNYGVFSKNTIHTIDMLLEDLKSERHKEIYNGQIVKYLDGENKPNKIIDRMKELYSRIDSSISYDFLDEIHQNAKSLDNLTLSNYYDDVDYKDFCDKYIRVVEEELSKVSSIYSQIIVDDNLVKSKYENVEDDVWEKRKKFILDSLKELGLRKDFRNRFSSWFEKNNYSFLNFYIVALAFQFQKDNIDNFSCILDDLNDRVPDYCTSSSSSTYFKYFLGYILGNKYYKDMINIRRAFKHFLEVYDGRFFKEYDIVGDEIERKNIDYYLDRHRIVDPYIMNEVLDCRVACRLDEDRKFFYDPILFKRRGRVSYINNKLYEIETNRDLREKLFWSINYLSNDMFECIDRGSDNDSFIECMNIVFDSDSFYELNSKLSCLMEANSLFKRESTKAEALRLIKELNGEHHKEVYCGKVVAFPDNTMRRISKPKTIVERMKYLYQRIDDSVSYDYIDVLHKKAIGDYRSLDYKLHKQKKNPVHKIKQKLKTLGSRKA